MGKILINKIDTTSQNKLTPLKSMKFGADIGKSVIGSKESLFETKI